MKNKFLLGFVIALTFAGAANASSWTENFISGWHSLGNYAAEKWQGVKNSFTSKKEKEQDTTQEPEKISQAEPEILPKEIASDWDKLTGKLTDALTLRDKQATLPKSSWLPFTETQEDNAKKINALLDAALKILMQGEAGTMRQETFAIREKISRQKIELDELRNKRITAPESSVLIWRMTKAKVDEKIAALQEEIQVNEEKLQEINLKLTDALKSVGLELDEQQAEILLNSVTGDDLLQNTVVFANVKAVVEKLEELAQNETNSLEITRRYTGMYLVLNDLLIHTQEELIRKIDGRYKPELNIIINEAENLKRDAAAKSRLNVYTPAQQKSFEANAQANAMTIQVGKLYIELLNSQRAGTMNSIKSLRLNRDLAENTYRTVRSSGELRGLIHSGLKVFDAVEGLSMPELKVFESGVMRLEFDEINRRLKK